MWNEALDRHYRSRDGCWPGAVLLTPDHHPVLRADIHAPSAGGAAVFAARLHQDLCDGRRRDTVGDARAGADGLVDPRENPVRTGQPGQPRSDTRLSPGDRLGSETAQGNAHHRRAGARDPGLAAVTSRRRRSEEHTSELQSLMRISYAVFCLKKKKKK